MKEYEISYISSPSLTEDARAELDNAVTEDVEAAKGAISHDTPNTRRRLAYEIEKQTVGFVRTIQAGLSPEIVNELRDKIKKHKGILRVSILQTAKRQDVTPDMLEVAPKKTREENQKDQEPAKEISMEEVEEKIEEALEEEVK